MKLRLIKLYDQVTDSFWFVPALMAILAVVLALSCVALDHHLGSKWVQNITWVWSGGADGARSVLSTVASSVMTVVSIVFSLTITTLAQTSSHYGPRVLRNFTSDRRVQITLGTFIATFVYCLLVLRTVRSVSESSFVPSLSVTLGVVLALLCLAVLIFFIHYVSESIQAETLIAGVGEDFAKTLDILFPERIGAPRPQVPLPEPAYWNPARPVSLEESGYMQRVDSHKLMDIATENDLQIKLDKRPGDFVGRNEILLRVLPADRVTEKITDALQGCFSLGAHRTPYQDVLYSLQQMVEIAAHALSPGINEPFTAMTCIDWLGTALRGIARRDLPPPDRYDEVSRLRVLVPPLDFEEITRSALEQIRIYGAESPDILVSMLDMLGSLTPDLHRLTDHEAIRHQIDQIGAEISQISNPADRARVEKHFRAALRTLTESAPKRSSPASG